MAQSTISFNVCPPTCQWHGNASIWLSVPASSETDLTNIVLALILPEFISITYLIAYFACPISHFIFFVVVILIGCLIVAVYNYNKNITYISTLLISLSCNNNHGSLIYTAYFFSLHCVSS